MYRRNIIQFIPIIYSYFKAQRPMMRPNGIIILKVIKRPNASKGIHEIGLMKLFLLKHYKTITDGPTDRGTDTRSYTDARTHLKRARARDGEREKDAHVHAHARPRPRTSSHAHTRTPTDRQTDSKFALIYVNNHLYSVYSRRKTAALPPRFRSSSPPTPFSRLSPALSAYAATTEAAVAI